ncbi:MAG: hypothetical protein H7061_13255 [Bdellovibrionaceae bacterium]|nr:hypothetical protein [Bdellovibrio sp.]
MLEIIFGLFLELAVYTLVELLTELGLRHSITSMKHEKKVNPYLAAVGYMFIAFILGGVSILLWPQHLIKDPDVRLKSLFITPIIAGYVMSQRGRILRLKQKNPIRLDSFIYGFLFALIFSLLRFYAAH